MLRFLFMVLALAAPSLAANYHVLREATGTRDGSDWVNANTNIPTGSSQVPGTTYIIGRGHYSAINMYSNSVSIVKATTNDHGSATGWSDAFATQAIFTNYVYWLGHNGVFDGRTGGGPAQPNGSGYWTNSFGSWTNWQGSWTQSQVFGFLIRGAVSAGSIGLQTASGVTNFRGRHFEAWGSGDDVDGPSTELLTFQYCTNIVVDNWYAHDSGRGIVLSRARDWAVGHFWMGKFESTAGSHAVGFSIANLDTPAVTNLWITNGVIDYIEGSGAIEANADNFTVANVIFGTCYDAGNYFGVWTGFNATRWKIHNCLFYGGCTLIYLQNGNIYSGNVVSNNIIYSAYLQGFTANGVVHNYNTYGDLSASSFDGRAQAEAESNGQFNWVAGNFIKVSAKDYRLDDNTSAGIVTAYAYDILGLPRTTMSRGPFEYQADQNPYVPPVVSSSPASAINGNVTIQGNAILR